MTVREATTHEADPQVVKPANLETDDRFGVFRGKNVPPGQKSMAYAFTYERGGKPDAQLDGLETMTTRAIRECCRGPLPSLSSVPSKTFLTGERIHRHPQVRPPRRQGLFPPYQFMEFVSQLFGSPHPRLGGEFRAA